MSAASRIVRDISIALLPAAYIMGFLAWSVHATRLGLGFIALDGVRYLVVGTGILFVLAISGMVVWAYWMLIPDEWHRTRSRQPTLNIVFWAFMPALALYAGMTMFLVLLGAFQGIHINALQLMLLGGVVGGLAAIGYLLVQLTNISVSLLSNLVRNRWRRRHQDRHMPRRVPRTRRIIPRWLTSDLAVSTAIAVLMLPISFGYLVLGEIEQDIGGGRPRTATLEMNPADLSPDLQQALFIEPSNQIMQTVPVEVLHDDQHRILIRASTAASANDPLYDISRHIVHGVVWMS